MTADPGLQTSTGLLTTDPGLQTSRTSLGGPAIYACEQVPKIEIGNAGEVVVGLVNQTGSGIGTTSKFNEDEQGREHCCPIPG